MRSDCESGSGNSDSLKREMWNVIRFCLLIAVVFACLIAASGKPPASKDLPMRPTRHKDSIPNPTPRLITVTNHLPPMPGQASGKVTTNTIAVISFSQPAPPRVPGVKRFTFTMTTPIAGMNISNSIDAATDWVHGPWTNLIWMTANGQTITVDIKIDPTLKAKYFKMGTNAYGP